MDKPPIKWFREHRCSPRIEIVSLGINLVDGTYEFGVLFVVNSPKYLVEFRSEIEHNLEFEDVEESFYSTLNRKALKSLLTGGECADVSLIALVEGLLRLRFLARKRVDLPNLCSEH
jgi:hypothetical protein